MTVVPGNSGQFRATATGSGSGRFLLLLFYKDQQKCGTFSREAVMTSPMWWAKRCKELNTRYGACIKGNTRLVKVKIN